MILINELVTPDYDYRQRVGCRMWTIYPKALGYLAITVQVGGQPQCFIVLQDDAGRLVRISGVDAVLEGSELQFTVEVTETNQQILVEAHYDSI